MDAALSALGDAALAGDADALPPSLDPDAPFLTARRLHADDEKVQVAVTPVTPACALTCFTFFHL